MMTDNGSYTPWLIRKSEREFFGKIQAYVEDIVDEIELLGLEVDCVAHNDYTKCMQKFDILSKKSKSTIKTRKDIIKELEQGNITPDNRGYIANLIYSLSDIAGYIDSASARLSLKDVFMSEELKDGMIQMKDETVHMIKLLRDAIELLNIDLEKTIEVTEEISTIEELIDDVRRRLLKLIVNDERMNKEASNMHVLIEMIGSIETVSDKIEAASNRLEVIAMTHLV
ncbi:DUF47 domain-containing protein [Candidatus Altiarchaeota archaeon]